MSNYRSHKRNYFMLLALMLLLPITGAFAYSTNFTVNVTDDTATPVEAAQVYLWDTYYSNYNTSGMTDAQGQANLTLTDMTNFADSTSQPSPNIGVLVIPPAGSDYAFKTARTLFLNVFGNEATAPAVDITLEQGNLVKIAPKYDDNPGDEVNPVSGVKTTLNIDYTEVPSDVAQISVDNSQLDGEGYYLVYWPAGKQVYGRMSSDGNRYVFSAPQYYDWHYFNFAAGAAGETTTEDVVHLSKPKGAFKVTENPTDAMNDPLAWRQLHNSITDIDNFVPGQLYWFPVGTYNFNYALNNFEVPVGSGFGAAKGIWTNVLITADNDDTNPVEKVFNIDGGTGLTVNVKLGEADIDGDETALSNSVVDVEKLVNFNGYQQWVGYESTPTGETLDVSTTSGVAIGKLYHRLSSGKYRIRIKDASDSSKPGVWDNNLNSFKYIVSEPFDIVDINVATLEKEIWLPQVPAFAAVVDATLSDSYQYATTKPVRVGYLPEPGMEQGSEITFNTSYTYNTLAADGSDYTKYNIHIPFPAPGKKIVVMANLYDTSIAERPALFKVFEPFAIAPDAVTQSPAAAYTIDNTNFVTRSGALMIDAQLYTGNATINICPVITQAGTDYKLPADKVFSDTYSMDHLTWDNSETEFAFAVEKDTPFYLTVVEGDSAANPPPPFGFNGFVKYEENIDIAADNNADIELVKGGHFEGQILVNGDPLDTAAQAFVRITKVLSDDWYGNALTRQGPTDPGGAFSVSGLESGQYNVAYSTDGIINAYDVQTMPLFSRTIFVDANNTPAEPLEFNLDSTNLGSVIATFTNEL
jgi:hypothetical protein